MDCEKHLKRIITALVSALIIFAPQVASAQQTEETGVFIVPGSTINLVSRQSNIPVQIKNTFASDVTVHLFVRPTSGKVVVQRAVAVKVPGNTTVTAKVPVQAIANGDVKMYAWLESFSGQPIGRSKLIHMNVNAEIEIASLIGFGAVISVLLVYGAIRTRRKNLTAGDSK